VKCPWFCCACNCATQNPVTGKSFMLSGHWMEHGMVIY
jgi:hypothetical protein